MSRIIVISLAIFLAAMCVIGRLIENDHRQTRNYLRQVIRWTMVVAFVLIALPFFQKDIAVSGLLLTIFLLLCIPVVIGMVTWLKHKNHSESQGI